MERRPVLVMAGVVLVRSRAEDTGVGPTELDLPPTSRREVASKTSDIAGDGTTTATVWLSRSYQ